MLRTLTLNDLGGGLNLVDIGASGALDRQWRRLEPLINLIGFEPNRDECKRLADKPTNFHSATYLPYAVGGENCLADLHKTKSIFCYSLLPPNQQWLDRFKFGELFQVVGIEPIETRRLDQLDELSDVDVDIIKTDTQGLELPILSTAGRVLERAFFVETETGFVPNYVGETTFDQIAEFMNDNGFLLFDMNNRHRIARRNVFSRHATGREQILWCEATWLRDYASESGKKKAAELDRSKALRALLLCAQQGCPDFGYEIAGVFHECGLLTKNEFESLSSIRAWQLPVELPYALLRGAFGMAFRMLPRGVRRELTAETERVHDQPHLLRSAVRMMKGKVA